LWSRSGEPGAGEIQRRQWDFATVINAQTARLNVEVAALDVQRQSLFERGGLLGAFAGLK
jgi:hypothetical protein